ncbi:MAG: tetratricopeptide repeat protein [Elusimicrobiota bacterium]
MKVIIFTAKVIISLVLLFCPVRASYTSDLDTVKTIYEKGVKNYDISLLNQAYSLLQQIPTGKEYEYFFLRGLCLRRIHFIYFLNGDKRKSDDLGKLAVKNFSEALNYIPNSIEAIAHRGMVYQILSGFSWFKGAEYGPKAQADLKTIKELDSEHFLSRFMNAIAYLESLRFFGGDTKKALKAFVNLAEDFPDDEDVLVYLARAYYKEEKHQNGLEIINRILANDPQNLFAQKIKKDIERRMREN